jgi:predicted mannosyl-3-phosphoglycerate phosphatase (HAD superfamily)
MTHSFVSTANVINIDKGESAIWQAAVKDKGISFFMEAGEVQVVGARTRDDQTVHVLLAQQASVGCFACAILCTLEDHPIALLMGQVAHTAQERREEGIGHKMVPLLTEDEADAMGFAAGQCAGCSGGIVVKLSGSF